MHRSSQMSIFLLLSALLVTAVVAAAGEDGSLWSDSDFVRSTDADLLGNTDQFASRQLQQQQPKSVTLLDTTEHSALGWTRYPDGGAGSPTRTPGWAEESYTNFERGINWRSFVVCDVAFQSVNNWLWTPFIERGDARRLYIEIKFTMRDCSLFPGTALSCKETFSLLYKEADAPLTTTPLSSATGAANASFAQSDTYKLVDTIAADDGRFTSNSDAIINTNVEIRSVPVTKRGVYFAFRDQGACLSLISIKVYHTYCPQLVAGLAQFNATPTGREQTSLDAVDGKCVQGASAAATPRMFCKADGTWTAAGATGAANRCRCAPGYEPTSGATRCLACAPGKFKPHAGDAPCQTCPERSLSVSAAAAECRCADGFYRANRDSRSAPCTQPPSAPRNLTATHIDASLVVLEWSPPAKSGNRDDVVYKLACEGCDPSTLISSPHFLANFSETRAVLAGLQANTAHRLVVYALNGVSALAAHPANFAEVHVTTLMRAPPPTSSSSPSSSSSSSSAVASNSAVFNVVAVPGARGSDVLLAWDAAPASLTSLGSDLAATSSGSAQQQPPLMSLDDAEALLPAMYEVRYAPVRRQDAHAHTQTTIGRALLVSNLSPRTEYAVQVRAKYAGAAWTDFCEPVFVTTGAPTPVTTSSSSGASSGALRVEDFAGNLGPQGAMAPPSSIMPPLVTITQQPPMPPPSTPSWLGTLAVLSVLALGSLALVSGMLLYHRQSLFVGRPAGGFGSLGSTYGAVYAGSEPHSLAGAINHAHHHNQHHATLAGGAFASTGTSSRSSSGGGAGNVMQSLIAATMGSLGAHRHHSHNFGNSGKPTIATTLGKPLFSTPTSTPQNVHHQHLSHQHQQNGLHAVAPQQRNHYHQTTIVAPHSQHSQQLHHTMRLVHYAPSHAQFQDPQMHIYDDLETASANTTATTTTNVAGQNYKQIDAQRVLIDEIVGEGEFGNVCRARLRLESGVEICVSVKTLKQSASDKAKLDFLTEAAVLGQFEHKNIVRFEGLAVDHTKQTAMLVTEYMQNGALDAYLVANKGNLGQSQLMSMLHDIASGMQYLAALNYVHKDLAARNVLVNGANVCKIADFGLAALSDDSTAASSSSSSSCSPSSGSSAAVVAASVPNSGPGSNQSSASTAMLNASFATTLSATSLSQLQSVAGQLAAQRFNQQQAACAPPNTSNNNNNPQKIPVRWTALESIAFKKFTSASDVWSFGVVCWEVMSFGERPFWHLTNAEVIKALEQGHRLPAPERCPEQLYKLMMSCWLKDRNLRPTFGQIVFALDRLLSPYDDPFGAFTPQQQHNQSQAQHQQRFEPCYDAYANNNSNNTGANNAIPATPTASPLMSLKTNQSSDAAAAAAPTNIQRQQVQFLVHKSVEDWLSSIKMSKYAENFHRHQISSLSNVSRLNVEDLNIIGVTNSSHQKKLVAAIQALRQAININSANITSNADGYFV